MFRDGGVFVSIVVHLTKFDHYSDPSSGDNNGSYDLEDTKYLSNLICCESAAMEHGLTCVVLRLRSSNKLED